MPLEDAITCVQVNVGEDTSKWTAITAINEDLSSTDWISSPISEKLGLPVKVKCLSSSQFEQRDITKEGVEFQSAYCKQENQLYRLLFLDCDIKSPTFGTYIREPFCGHIQVARCDGKDLEVRDLIDLAHHLDGSVEATKHMLVKVLLKREPYENAKETASIAFSQDYAKRNWDKCKREERLRGQTWRAGRENPFRCN